MESQSGLQKELQKAKHDAREAIEAKDVHADEMADLRYAIRIDVLIIFCGMVAYFKQN